jgi:hypothetical protein
VVGALVGGPEVQKVSVKFRGVYGGILGRMDEKMANRKKEPDADTEDRYTVPFPSLLEEYKVPRTIDYMSLDVEGYVVSAVVCPLVQRASLSLTLVHSSRYEARSISSCSTFHLTPIPSKL